MPDEVFDVGDVVVLTHTVTADGVPADPSTILVKLKGSSGVVHEAEWAGGAGQVARVGLGVFVYQLALDEPGTWRWRWETSGTAQEADEGRFRVRRSAFVTP